MLNDRASTLSLLASRRSGRPRDMVPPGPGTYELETILAAGARVPDHGKLSPWRFVVVPAAERAAFERLLLAAYDAETPEPSAADRDKLRQFAGQAPALVAVLSHPTHGHKIPLWEQEMSAGAACQNMLVAAHAQGYVGGWLTGWAAYSPTVYAALGGEPGGRTAGFLFFGTPARPLEERPRPSPAQVTRIWTGAPA